MGKLIQLHSVDDLAGNYPIYSKETCIAWANMAKNFLSTVYGVWVQSQIAKHVSGKTTRIGGKDHVGDYKETFRSPTHCEERIH